MSKALITLRKMSSAIGSNLLEATTPPLTYQVIAECPTTKARVGVMTLRHGNVDTPVFMPVGTQVCMFSWFCNAGNLKISIIFREQ